MNLLQNQCNWYNQRSKKLNRYALEFFEYNLQNQGHPKKSLYSSAIEFGKAILKLQLAIQKFSPNALNTLKND